MISPIIMIEYFWIIIWIMFINVHHNFDFNIFKSYVHRLSWRHRLAVGFLFSGLVLPIRSFDWPNCPKHWYQKIMVLHMYFNHFWKIHSTFLKSIFYTYHRVNKKHLLTKNMLPFFSPTGQAKQNPPKQWGEVVASSNSCAGKRCRSFAASGAGPCTPKGSDTTWGADEVKTNKTWDAWYDIYIYIDNV